MPVEKFSLRSIAEGIKKTAPKPEPRPKSADQVKAAKPGRELTDAELVQYLEAKKKMGMEPIEIPEGDKDPKNPERLARVQGLVVVMDPKNPYLSMYREYIGGVISFEEMQLAIDTQLCNNLEALKAFHWRDTPEKPEALDNAEFDLRRKTETWDKAKRAEAFRALYVEAKNGKFSAYYKALETVEAENKQNLSFILEVYERQHYNETFKQRLLAVIETHKKKGRLV